MEFEIEECCENEECDCEYLITEVDIEGEY